MGKDINTTCDEGQTAVVAFHPTQDPISSVDGSTHAMGCGSSGGCCTQAVAFTKSKRAQSTTDDKTWVPGEVSPTMSCFDQGDTRATTVVAFTTEQTPKFKDDCALTITKQSPSGGGQPQCVAFTQNCRDEVRQINGDGHIAGALAANSGSHQTNYLAYAIDGGNQAASEEVHHSLRTGRDSGDAVAFAQNQLGEVRTNAEVMGTVNTNQNASGRNTPMVQQAMAVRRLTPRECERLQGFPDHYTLVEYRKKPAADGPRYRALGNSMAVPVMRWIGERIAMVEGMR
jgi:DNA (cytosine-5)-methyltransferase 1